MIKYMIAQRASLLFGDKEEVSNLLKGMSVSEFHAN